MMEKARTQPLSGVARYVLVDVTSGGEMGFLPAGPSTCLGRSLGDARVACKGSFGLT